MKSLFLIIFLVALSNKFCNGQAFQVIAGNKGTYEGSHNDLMLLSANEVIDLDRADIKGNPFWSEDWKPAILYTGENAILVSKVKVNLYKNDVWYISPEGLSMVAKTGVIKGITFFKGDDTSSVLANFVYLKNEGDKDYHFYEFMNRGKAQLLKLNKVTVHKHPFDAFKGKSDLSYTAETEYYLNYNKFLTPLKKHNKEVIFSVLRPNDSDIDWLNKNKNSLKSISDILNFLNYFNTQAGR